MAYKISGLTGKKNKGGKRHRLLSVFKNMKWKNFNIKISMIDELLDLTRLKNAQKRSYGHKRKRNDNY